MPVPPTEQIKRWRKRWEKFNNLHLVIAWILTRDVVDRPPENANEAADRMLRVNEILRNGEFDVYEGEGEWAFIEDEEVSNPSLDLRGVHWKGLDLSDIILPHAHLEGANLEDAHLERANLEEAQLEGAILTGAHVKGADLLGVHLEGANLRDAHLEGANLHGAHLEGADLTRVNLEGANLERAHLEGAKLEEANLKEADLLYAHLLGVDFMYTQMEGANLWGAHLEGANFWESNLAGANLGNVVVGKIINFDDDTQLTGPERITLLGKQTRFLDIEFLPRWRDFFKVKFSLENILGFLRGIRWRDWWNFNTCRWSYTDFVGVRIDDADTTQAADLNRYVNDQQFLSRFKKRHPVGYNAWKWLTGCGDNLYLLAFWSSLVVLIFASLYSMPWEWLSWIPFQQPSFLMMNQPLVNAEPFISEDFIGPEWVKCLLISFDIFTNLGIRTAHPHSTAGAFVVFLETLFGFVSLGLFIAVATNKFVRRS